MQVAGSLYSLALNASSSSALTTSGQGSKSSDFASLENFDSSQNAIFQNYLKDPSVQKLVTQETDGSYSFNWNPSMGALNFQQGNAKHLIEAQNGDFDTTNPQALGTRLSVHDLEVYRQVTGYNYLQTGDGYTFTDDSGNEPPASMLDFLEKTADAFQTAKGIQWMRGESGDLSNDDLQSVLKSQEADDPTEGKMYEALMKAVEHAELSDKQTLKKGTETRTAQGGLFPHSFSASADPDTPRYSSIDRN